MGLSIAPTTGVGIEFGPRLLWTSIATGHVQNSVAETSLLTSGIGTRTIPANRLKQGTTINILAEGHNLGSVGGTYRVKLGATQVASGTLDGIGSTAGHYFGIRAQIVCREVGTAGKLAAAGILLVGESPGVTRSAAIRHNNGLPTTIDTTQPLDIDLNAKMAAAANNVGVTIQTCQIFLVD